MYSKQTLWKKTSTLLQRAFDWCLLCLFQIPEVVYQLRSLTTLLIRFNRIKSVDEAIRNLTVSIFYSLLNCKYSKTKLSLTLRAPAENAIILNRLLHIFDYCTNVSMEANSVDLDQTHPIGAVWSGSTMFIVKSTKPFQQTTKAEAFCCDLHFKD